MKRLLVRATVAIVLAAIAGVVLAVVPSVPTSEKVYEITDASVRIELQEDGSLHVRESLPFDFHGSFTGAYRDIPLSGDAQITDLAVVEGGQRYRPGGNTVLGSYDRPGTFGTELFEGAPGAVETTDAGRAARVKRVVWHYDAADEVRTFDIVYRVTGAANVRDDVVDVTWSIWGKEWQFWLDHLDAEISAASGVAPLEAWVRPRSVGAEADVGDAATVSIDRLAEGKAVGMRAVFPHDAISSTAGAEVDGGDGLEEIREEEAALDDEYSLLDRSRNLAAENQLAIAIALLVLGVGLVTLLCLLARERSVDVPEYLPEPPEDVPPALAYAFAREGEYDQRVVLASMLDLVDRGYYEARPAPGDELDLEVRLAEERPATTDLEEHEVATLDFFDRLLGHDWVAVGKMKDRVPKHSSSWRNRWQDLNDKLDEAETSFMGWDRDLTTWRALLVLLFGAAAVLFTWLVWSRTNQIAIPVAGLIATVGLMCAPPGVWLKRLDAESRLRSARWHAFDRWTADFPRLHDDPPATLKLWRRILVYAVAFGTAERIAKSGRIPAPVAEEAQSGGYWTSYAFYGAGFASFSDFGSGFSSQVAPESSSSGGSGFSGGGGGGFSGGGGGGAW